MAFTGAVVNSADAGCHRRLVSGQAASAQLKTGPVKPSVSEAGESHRHVQPHTPTQDEHLTLDRCEASLSKKYTELHFHAQQLGTKHHGTFWRNPIFESSFEAAQLVMTPQRQLHEPELGLSANHHEACKDRL